jgi:hypothetical protein
MNVGMLADGEIVVPSSFKLSLNTQEPALPFILAIASSLHYLATTKSSSGASATKSAYIDGNGDSPVSITSGSSSSSSEKRVIQLQNFWCQDC